MKQSKIIFLALLLLLSVPLYADIIDLLSDPKAMSRDSLPMREINLKVSFDFDGTFKSNRIIGSLEEKKLTADNNVSFAAEYVKYFTEYIGAGAGISAQIPRSIDELSGKFGFAPLYLSVKVRSWPQEPGLYGYVLGQIGYNFLYGDSAFKDKFSIKEGGFYYGVGLGVVYKMFIVEGIYSVNSGVIEDNVNTIDIDYDKFTVSIGCRL